MPGNQIKPEWTNNRPKWKRDREIAENESTSSDIAEIRKTQQHLKHKSLSIYFRLKSILLQHFSIVTWILFLVFYIFFIICLFSSFDDDSKSIVHDSKWWNVQIVNGIGHVSCSWLPLRKKKKLVTSATNHWIAMKNDAIIIHEALQWPDTFQQFKACSQTLEIHYTDKWDDIVNVGEKMEHFPNEKVLVTFCPKVFQLWSGFSDEHGFLWFPFFLTLKFISRFNGILV